MDANSLGFKSQSSYYEKSSVFITDGQPKWVAVWVESDDDKKLWYPVLKNTYKKYKFKFHLASAHEFKDGKVADGCSRIFTKINSGEIELGKSTIACLDSDYSFISGNYACKQKDLLESPYVFQTYVHSKENVYIHPVGVVQIFERALGEDLEYLGLFIENFTEKLAESVHGYLLKLVSLYQFNDICAFDHYHKKFVEVLRGLINEMSVPDVFSSDLKDEFILKFKSFDDELTHHIESTHGEHILTATQKRFEELEVASSDSLSFIRGHDLYPAMMKFYKAIDQYVFKVKRDQFNKEYIPAETRKKKLTEMANSRVSIEDLICTRCDVKNNQYFALTFKKLDRFFA